MAVKGKNKKNKLFFIDHKKFLKQIDFFFN